MRGRAFAFDHADGAWRSRTLDLPQNATIGIAATSDENGQAMFSVTDYLTPSSLWFYDGATGTLETISAKPTDFERIAGRCSSQSPIHMIAKL